MNSMMIRYYWYKERGICVVCGQEDAVKGKIKCLNCLDGAAVATMIYRSKHDTSEYNKEHCKSRYYKAKEAGLCVRCFKREPREGKSICQYCFSKIKDKQAIAARLKRWRKKEEIKND